MDPDPESRRKESMIRDFLSRWGRVAAPAPGLCRACGSKLVSDDLACPACGIPPEALVTAPRAGAVTSATFLAPGPPPVAPAEALPPAIAPAEVLPPGSPPGVQAGGPIPAEVPPPVAPPEVPPPEETAAPETPAGKPAPVPEEAARSPPTPEKAFLGGHAGKARCSACDTEVLADATLCPACGARFVAAPAEEPLLRKVEMAPAKRPVRPAERLRALKEAVVAGACPACGSPVPGGVKICPLCGSALKIEGELEAARQLVVESVRRPASSPPPPEPAGSCRACGASFEAGATVCLACGTSLGGEGVRRLARPFEPAEEPAPALPVPVERRGEELEISKGAGDWQSWLVQGDIFYNSGHTDKALESYDRSLYINESYEAYNNKGLVLYREGDLEGSLACFDRALGLHKGDEFIWYNRGNALRDLGRFRECIESYDRAISLKPDFEKAWVASGAALLARGRSEEAVICFEAALKINWDNEQTWHAIGNAMFRMRRHAEAETVYNKAVEIRPDFWQAWYDKAELAVETGNIPEAIAALRKVTELNPTHWRSWLEVGGLQSDLGDEREAMRCYARAAELNPESWEAWRALGHEYFSLKRFNDAARAFARATKLNSRDGALWLEAAECYYITGNPNLAIKAVEMSLRLKESPQAWLSKGIALVTIGDRQGALDAFRKGIALDPASPRLWFELASVQRLLGDMESALKAYDEAVELNPNYEKALSAKGKILMDLGKAREALEHYDRAVALRPSLDKLQDIAELREMMILSEAAREKELAPMPQATRLTAEEVFHLGMGLGALDGKRPPPLAAGAGAGPAVVLEPADALAPEELVETPGPAAGAPAEVPDLTGRPAGLRDGPAAPLEFEPVGPAALVSSPPRERAAPALAAGTGLANGRGLTNGWGPAKGRGPAGGRGITNGLQAGRSLTNGKGLINGRGKVNGAGLINGRGITNGRSLINGNGIVNGRGFITGQPGEEDSPYNAVLRKQKRRGWALGGTVAAVILAAFFILPAINLMFQYRQGIQIDGDLGDWAGAPVYHDSVSDMEGAPSVNIVDYGTLFEQDWAFFRVKAAGRILEGAQEGVDSLRIFIDTDRSTRTGYLVAGLGADRMLDVWGFGNRVRGAEVMAFNRSRGQLDWNGWYIAAAARAGSGGDGLEAGAPSGVLGLEGSGRYLAAVLLQDGRGNRDGSDLVFGGEQGALSVEQAGLVPAEISNLSARLPLLALNLTSQAGDVPLTAITLEALGTAEGRPTGLADVSLYIDQNGDGRLGPDDLLVAAATPQNGTFREVFTIPSIIRPGGMFSLVAIGSIKPDAPAGAPVGVRIPGREAVEVTRGAATVMGSGKLGFVIQTPPRIVIDGSFDDWAGVAMQNDSADAVNTDIDITHYATSADRDVLSFFLDVRGTMLRGTETPAPSRARPSKPGPVQPPPPEAPLPLPVVTGEDTAAVFVDADRNASTGIPVAGLGADFALQASGRDNSVFDSAFFRAGTDGNWTLAGAVPAAVDERRLETQISFGAMGIPASTVDVVMYATDWIGNRDYTPDARGRGGRLQLSARDIAPAAFTRGTSWPMLAMTFTATGSVVHIYSLEFTLLGDAAGADVPTAFLFIDGDRDGQFSDGDRLLAGGEGNFSGRRYSCMPRFPITIPEGGTVVLFSVLSVSPAASAGARAGLSLAGPSEISCSALGVDGAFPMASSAPSIASAGGRGASGPDETGSLSVSYYVPKSRVNGNYEPGRGGAGGRTPSGGWPSRWTLLTNDSETQGPPDDLDITSIRMADSSDYIFFNITVQNISGISVNDEWNFYFKTNDSSNNHFDMWYRLTLRVTNATAPSYNSTLSSYIGDANPPDRDRSWSVNETDISSGNSSDQTAYGFMVDPAANSVLFYAIKSSISGNMLGAGNTTKAYADTWYTNNNKWKRSDRGPDGNKTKEYTMVPEFQDVMLPVAGSILVFVILRGRTRRARRRPAGRRHGRRQRT